MNQGEGLMMNQQDEIKNPFMQNNPMPPKGGNMKIWHDKLTASQKAAYQKGIDQVKSEL